METELDPTQPETQEVVTISPTSFYAPDQFPELETAVEGVSLTPKYYEFKNAGETVRAVFCGFSSMHSKNKDAQIPLAILQTKEGFFVNAGANLVSQLQKLPPKTAVQITYNGTQKTGGGNNVKTFDVRLLTIGTHKAEGNGNGHTKSISELRVLYGERMSEAKQLGVKAEPLPASFTVEQIVAAGKVLKAAIDKANEF